MKDDCSENPRLRGATVGWPNRVWALLGKPAVAPAVLAGLAVALWPSPAAAMHISEGILPASWAGLWFLVAVPVVMWGLRTINRRRATDPRWVTMVALVGSAVFVTSCMPVPLPSGTCSHPCGTGLGALLIGPGPTVVVASVALLLQALFLAHGGLTTLGANIVSMGIVGAYAAYGTFWFLRKFRLPLLPAAFAAGLLGDWATYVATSLELSAGTHADGSFWAMAVALMLAFVPTQVPLGIAEGIVTAIAYRFVLERRPDLVALRHSEGFGDLGI
jgi:cobalt/nickel transport system permease protein